MVGCEGFVVDHFDFLNVITELPYNDYFEYYGPEFKLDVPSNNMENHNTREYLEKIA